MLNFNLVWGLVEHSSNKFYQHHYVTTFSNRKKGALIRKGILWRLKGITLIKLITSSSHSRKSSDFLCVLQIIAHETATVLYKHVSFKTNRTWNKYFIDISSASNKLSKGDQSSNTATLEVLLIHFKQDSAQIANSYFVHQNGKIFSKIIN
jgi:hypothetical protein